MIYHYHKDGTKPPTNQNYVFVFGSNLAGVHGAGAALEAKNTYGAKTGNGIGLVGMSYAIPTKNIHIQTIHVEIIFKYINSFIKYSTATPNVKYWITRVGCGLAGYEDKMIAPLFKGAPDNCNFPEEWREYIE